jgi:ketosteroid isomerase-like protein
VPTAILAATVLGVDAKDAGEPRPVMMALAAQVRTALDSADPEQFGDLLDPNVTWGAPGDASPPCRNRQQVRRWYQQGRADGRRAQVLDIACHRDKLLVSMRVTSPGSAAADAGAERWQVLTVTDGRISDIRGYERREDALAAAGPQG